MKHSWKNPGWEAWCCNTHRMRPVFCIRHFINSEERHSLRSLSWFHFPPTGEFTRSASGSPRRWRSATSPTQTQLPKAAQPPRTNLSFKKRPDVPRSFFLSYLLSVHMFTLLRGLCCGNAIWKKRGKNPNVSISSPTRTWTTWEKQTRRTDECSKH